MDIVNHYLATTIGHVRILDRNNVARTNSASIGQDEVAALRLINVLRTGVANPMWNLSISLEMEALSMHRLIRMPIERPSYELEFVCPRYHWWMR